MSRVYF